MAVFVLLAALVAVGVTVALHGTDGSVVAYTLPLRQGQFPYIDAIDPASGQVYVTTYSASETTIRVLSVASQRWHTLNTASNASPPLLAFPSHAGRVFLLRSSPSGQQTQVQVLNAANARLLRTTTIPLAPSYLTGALVERAGLIAAVSPGFGSCTGTGPGQQSCTTAGGGVALLDPASGQPRRLLSVPGQAWMVGLDARATRVLVTSSTGSNGFGGHARLIISVFDTGTGRLLHRVTLTTPTLSPVRMAVDAATRRAFLLATVDSVPRPMQSLKSYFYVLDLHNGALLRTLTWAGAANDVAVDQRSGRVFVTDAGPERFLQKMVAGGGGMGVFMPLGPGALHVLDARTGAPLATVAQGIAPSAIAVDERRNRVYVVNAGSHDAYSTAGSTPIDIRALVSGPGGLSVLDATSGRLLRSVTLGTQPSSIALDTSIQQAFIGDTGDGAPQPQPDPWGWLLRPVRRFLAFLPQRAPPSRPRPGRVIVVDTARL